MKRFIAFGMLLAWTAPADSAIVQLDYSYDAANGNFFGLNATAKAAVDAAAQDLNNAIVSTLGAVATDVYTGTNGGTTATFDWNLNFTNPSTGVSTTLNTFNAPVNLVTVYVGMRPLSGTTLGVGGPASGGYSLSIGGAPPSPSEWIGAVGAAENSSNAAMTRGSGPVIGTLTGTAPFGPATANFALTYGAIAGSLSFDNDTNNDGTADDAAALAAYWSFNHSAPVEAGKNDFYSVALHEMLHAIGIGTSSTWNAKVAGTNWTGTNVITLAGSGTGLISADGGHIAPDTMSVRLSDGLAQEAVMDPSITQGTSKSLTQLDLAFLRDLGFTTVPEPTSLMLVVAAGLPLAFSRRRKMPVALA